MRVGVLLFVFVRTFVAIRVVTGNRKLDENLFNQYGSKRGSFGHRGNSVVGFALFDAPGFYVCCATDSGVGVLPVGG